MSIRRPPPQRGREAGMVLIVGLVLLAVLTVIGVTAMQSTTLEERMAGNYQRRVAGFQAAEAALRDAEQALIPGTLVFDNTNGHYQAPVPGDPPRWLTIYGPGAQPGNGATVPLVNGPDGSQASYFIEKLPTFVTPGNSLGTCDEYGGGPTCQQLYQITAFGSGPAGQSKVVLQSVFRP